MPVILKPFRPLLAAALAAVIGFAATAEADYEKVSFSPAPAAALQQHKLALKYDVYAGGFKALNASLEMDIDKKAYDMKLEAETQGMIGSLFPWKASFNTSGHTKKDALIPTVYTSRSTWKKGVKITEMNYAPDGKVLKMTTQSDGKTETDRDIDEVLADKTVDLLTGALNIFRHVKKTASCKGKFPVFDGKRRFNITLVDDGKEVLPPSRYSRFSGEALRCTLKVEPVAGFNKKDQKRGWMAVQNHTEERHKLPTLWLAAVKENNNQVIPVRMEIASAYGSVVAHLTGQKTDN